MPTRPPIPDGAVDTPPALARRMARELFESAGPGPVLDPACGTGELLLAALAAAGGGSDFAARKLFGIELCPDRAQTARARILEALVPTTSEPGLQRVSRALEENIRCADALDPAVAWPAAPLILANPPWLSLSGRQAADLPAEKLALYRRTWTSLERGWPSIHGAFLERIALHLSEIQRLGHDADHDGTTHALARVLIPSAMCELDRYGPTRAAVRRHAHLAQEPIDLGEGVFPGITQPTSLLTLAGGHPALKDSPQAWALAHFDRLNRFPRLPEGSFADPGVHTGNSARELVFDSLEHEQPDCASMAPIRVGRDLLPYALRAPSQWLRTDLVRSRERRFRIPALERMRAFPILLRQTSAQPMAALHTEATYFRNSLLGCRGVEGLDPAFIIAVLNSPLIATWHRLAHRDARQRNFPQVKVSHLAALPFPILHRREAPRLHDEIAALVRDLDPNSARAADSIAQIEARVEAAFGLTRNGTSG